MRFKLLILLLFPFCAFAQRRTTNNSVLTKGEVNTSISAAAPSILNGTGFVKASGLIISYDNSTYLTTTGNGGSLTGLTATQVGLGNVNNTSDAAKPVSTATQTALDLKANLISPSFTTPTLGTPASGNLANCTFPTLNQNTSGTASKFTGMTFAEVNTAVTDANLARTDGTNTFTGVQSMTTPDFTTGFTIGTAAATGKFVVGNGTNYVPSTSTIPTNAGATAGKMLVSDGTNYVLSTPTFPNASATSGKIVKSDGTNWVASTETYATPGTSGNISTSDGTNWTSAANTGGWTEKHVTVSDATTTGQTLVDVTGLTSGTLTNSTKYEFEAVLDVSTSAVTTGVQYGIFGGGSGGAAVVSAILTGNTTGTTASSEGLSTTPATASTARLLTSSQTGTMIIKGFITTRGSGTATISVQHLKVTSGTSTVKIGSVFRYRLAQ